MATITVNPYNDISAGTPATEDGTWSYVSNPTPAPTLPVLFDDDLVFDDTTNPFGTYILKYTVDNSALVGICTDNEVEDEKTFTYEFQNTYIAPNDECVGSISVPFPYSGTSQSLNRTNANNCPGAYYTVSASVPAGWGTNTWAGDAWFKIIYSAPSGALPLALHIYVDGSPFGTAGINLPHIAVYETTSTCPGTLVDFNVSVNQEANVTVSDLFATSTVFYLRVGCPLGNAGLFNIYLTL